MKKLLLTTILVMTSNIAQAIMPIASPNEPCMWPWTRPNITVGSKWEAVRCTGKNPYTRLCETEIYDILDVKNGYAKYNLTYISRNSGNKVTIQSSGNVKFMNCSYDSFKKI